MCQDDAGHGNFIVDMNNDGANQGDSMMTGRPPDIHGICD